VSELNTKQHYEDHLHSYYTWIYGGYENKVEENRAFFNEMNIKPESTKIALDLGAGSGFQSIPLAELGFEVKAVDFSKKLLDELNFKKKNLDIGTIEGDILNFSIYTGFNPELIICMGDTLTHLQNLQSVEELVMNCRKILNKDGRIIFTFRDLTYELKDEKRFIPVRSDENRIFTCFLENFQDHLKVFDMVNEKENGKWSQKISFYIKIKISEDNIKKIFSKSGFNIDYFMNKNGLITIIGRKK
jgi:2-polyprenyl-3-methyl-5-hydroxy-6-metoxy-1,4-benzoquinol methylase